MTHPVASVVPPLARAPRHLQARFPGPAVTRPSLLFPGELPVRLQLPLEEGDLVRELAEDDLPGSDGLLALHDGNEPELDPDDRHRIRLYDLRADPQYQLDVWEEHPEIASEYRQFAIDWLGRRAGHDWRDTSKVQAGGVARQMAALGYNAGAEIEATEWFDTECTCAWHQRFD